MAIPVSAGGARALQPTSGSEGAPGSRPPTPPRSPPVRLLERGCDAVKVEAFPAYPGSPNQSAGSPSKREITLGGPDLTRSAFTPAGEKGRSPCGRHSGRPARKWGPRAPKSKNVILPTPKGARKPVLPGLRLWLRRSPGDTCRQPRGDPQMP